MFDRLRLKLTLINVSITAILFLILIAGVYILLDYNSQRSTSFFLNRITEKIMTKQLTDIPPRINKSDAKKYPGFLPPPPRPNFFFIKTDANGQAAAQSSGMPLDSSAAADFLAAVQDADSYGKITFRDTPITYLRTPLADGGVLLVCNDHSEEMEVMRTLLANISYVGLLCMILCFFASFYMAKHAIKPIQYALDQQKSFVSNASHELRTPITIMQTNLDILRGAPPGDTLDNNRKWLDNLQGETTRMTELVSSLLFLARADANQQLMEKEYFSLNETILDAVTPLQLLAAAKPVALTTDITGALTALGDPARIKQLLTILIDNAIRHTPPYGTIVVSCRQESGHLLLRVADNGEGIAAEYLPKVFDRFYQADSSRHKGGAGLGLSMAKWITKQHGGSIAADSQYGKGTVITVCLPLPVHY